MVIVDTVHRATPKEHLVFRQRARLVGENMLHLSELFGDIHGTTFAALICLHVEHFDVIMDMIHLQDLAQLDGDVQRQGNHYL